MAISRNEMKEKKKNRMPADTIAYAKKSLEKGGLHILYDDSFQKTPFVDIYVAQIPDECQIKTVFPSQRNIEIQSVTNTRYQKEKYCVWQLLCYGLERSLGLKAEKIDFVKNESGKWTSSRCHFSLTHSNGIVAVAISGNAVGIDIESLDCKLHSRFSEKILTEKEKTAEYTLLEPTTQHEYLIIKWSAKEAFFKREGGKYFSPSTIDTPSEELWSCTLDFDNKPYICTVATATPDKIRFFNEIEASKYL